MNLKQKRQKRIRLRKNFLPTLLVIVLLWSSIFFIVYFVDPKTHGALIILFVISFLALLLTFATIFANTRRGLLAAITLTIFLLFAYLGIGNIINLLLLIGIAITTEYYLMKK
jgi:hypothetical protein